MANVIEQWGCTSFISSVKLVIAIQRFNMDKSEAPKKGKKMKPAPASPYQVRREGLDVDISDHQRSFSLPTSFFRSWQITAQTPQGMGFNTGSRPGPLWSAPSGS